jgi:carboxyl-terminal processing protease
MKTRSTLSSVLIGIVIGMCCFAAVGGTASVLWFGFGASGVSPRGDTLDRQAPDAAPPARDPVGVDQPVEPGAVAEATRIPGVPAPALRTPGPRAPDSQRSAWPVPRRPTALAATPNASIAAGEKETQRALWEEIWRKVEAFYVDGRFRGLDWTAQRESFLAEIDTGLSRERFYERVFEIIDQLNDDHTEFNSPLDIALFKLPNGDRGWTGTGILAGVNTEERRLYVRKVVENSPAARAGIVPHTQILTIDGQPAVIDDQPVTWRYRLNLTPGTRTVLSLRTPGGETREVTLVQETFAIASEQVTGRMLPGSKKILLVDMPTLNESLSSAEFGAILRVEVDNAGGSLDGLILDLRTCPGGAERNLLGVLGRLTEPGVIGENVDRDGAITQLSIDADQALPVGNSGSVPIVILIGRDTNSAAEILAGVLKHRHPDRVRLVGERTRGNIEGILPFDFDDGSVLYLATSSFRLPDGSTWEGRGLTPDVTVDAAWDTYAGGEDDPVLAAALKALPE